MTDRERHAGTPSVERRLTAILSADAKGYSRLMSIDEIGTVRTLTAHRAVMRDAIARFRGRVVDSPGDNLLAEFPSVVDAVECAADIQHALGQRNAELPEERRLAFRIGVNIGEVLIEGDRIYGDAVNVAARLEALADAGGICISDPVYEHVAPKLALKWESLGEQPIKNIARRVHVYRARLLPGALPTDALLRPAYRPSIAVLPFRELDAVAAHRYFAEGIVEDIIGALASLTDLFVISRTSTARYQGDVDVASVGRELAVRYVLSGSVRRAGKRIRITAELSDTDTETVLWTDRIEGGDDDLFALQDQLSEKTVTTIAPYVRAAEIRRALRKRPDSLDAYDFMLRGLDLLYRLRRGDFERAREMFDRSLSLDPAYATPYALTALWHSIRIGQGWSPNTLVDYADAGRFAQAALERDAFDASALSITGHVRALLFHDYEGALSFFDRAIAASPNSAVAWIRSSPTYSYVGDAVEAKRRAQIGLRLSPFDPHLFYAYTALGFASYTARDFEDSIAWGRKAMAHNPNFTANLRFLAASLAATGRISEAADVGRALVRVEPGFRVNEFCENYAYKDSTRRTALAEHLRSAGLPP
jgi:TolB-like protein/class 3 adenylate cyclase